MTAILRRELITLLRTRAAVAVQLGIAFAFALLVLLRWPTEARVAEVKRSRALRVVAYHKLIERHILLIHRRHLRRKRKRRSSITR